jgi:hypothetical protein
MIGETNCIFLTEAEKLSPYQKFFKKRMEELTGKSDVKNLNKKERAKLFKTIDKEWTSQEESNGDLEKGETKKKSKEQKELESSNETSILFLDD